MCRLPFYSSPFLEGCPNSREEEGDCRLFFSFPCFWGGFNPNSREREGLSSLLSSLLCPCLFVL